MTGKLHYLTQGDLSGLFVEELSWDHPRGRSDRTVTVDGIAYPAKPVAEKAGVVVLRVPDPLDAAARDQIKRELRRHYAESLAVFVDGSDRVTFEWTEDRASGTKRRVTHTFVPGRANTALLERLASISFEGDRPNPTVVEVRGKLAQTFTVDRVTKDFYRKYDNHHKKVTAAIQGIPGEDERRWYTSILLNRLMFVYFLQKRGFLDGDVNYLRGRFETVRAQHGEGQYQTFFRAFLRHLFITGLGEKPELRDQRFTALIGDVPYVNGGLFSQHEIESRHTGIDIPDAVFDDLFTFLDSYQWHLDDRPLADERTINPDVLGYIFEQYINQKEQGAYYTKEDVTGYMCRQTILPWVLDCAARFAAERNIIFEPWELLRHNPARYLPSSLLHGTTEQLPQTIMLDSDEGFERAADEGDEFRLPTESWIECWARRRQAEEAQARLGGGAVTASSAAVSLNVDLLKMVVDFVAECDEEAVLDVLWEATLACTTIDPTCGSGAFLFAALQVIEDIADAVYSRLDALVPDERRAEHAVLGPALAYRSHQYWLRKRIILHNLYGVDLMVEATEVAKLRLFLALLSHVERREDLEPLPDLDFNIRAGNAVVGYVSADEIRGDLTHGTLFDADWEPTSAAEAARDDLVRRAAEMADRYSRFREMQSTDAGAGEHAKAKRDLKEGFEALASELDLALAQKRVGKKRAEKWADSAQPFHWFAAFPSVLLDGRFAVVVGNPPYIGRRKKKASGLGPYDAQKNEVPFEVKQGGRVGALYTINGFATTGCPDLYAMVVERSVQLCGATSRMAMIVPHSISFSENFAPVRQVIERAFKTVWVSSYSRIPAGLFPPSVRVRNSILLSEGGAVEKCAIHTTRLHRWNAPYRPHLFACLNYCEPPETLRATAWPFLGDNDLGEFFDHVVGIGGRLASSSSPTAGSRLGFKTSAYADLPVFLKAPPVEAANGSREAPAKVGWVPFSKADADTALVVLAGQLGLAWWLITGDDLDVTKSTILDFPIDLELARSALPPGCSGNDLQIIMDANLAWKANAGKRIGRYNADAYRAFTEKTDRQIVQALWPSGAAPSLRALRLARSQAVRSAAAVPDTADESDGEELAS
jgi:hypothetical protein